jgi:YD repeat-containing protein
VPDKIYTLETNSPFSSFIYFNGTVKDSHYNSTPDVSFDAYNSNGNLRQSTERNGRVTSYLWDSTGNYPMAKVVNATYSQISSQDGKVATFNSKTLNNSLRSLVPEAQVQTFSYKPLLGMTSQTDPNGIVINYEYDTFGRLKLQQNDDTHIVNRYKYHYKQ